LKYIPKIVMLCAALACHTAHADTGRWELGVGISNNGSKGVSDAFPALRVSGRTERGAFGFFANGMYRANGLESSASPLTHTLLSIMGWSGAMGSVSPMNLIKERWVFAAGVDWGFGRRAPVSKGLSGGPRLYLEVEARIREHGLATMQETAVVVSDVRTRFNVGPAIGASLDVWVNQKVGMRLGVENRLFVESEPSLTFSEEFEVKSRVKNELGLTIDLLFGTGGAK
jgi:hypothetical protein